IGYMIAATQEPVRPIDHHHLQVVDIPFPDLFDITRQLPRSPIILQSQRADLLGLLSRSLSGNPSLKTLTRVLSMIFVSLLLLLPMMSLFSTASIFQLAAFAFFAI